MIARWFPVVINWFNSRYTNYVKKLTDAVKLIDKIYTEDIFHSQTMCVGYSNFHNVTKCVPLSALKFVLTLVTLFGQDNGTGLKKTLKVFNSVWTPWPQTDTHQPDTHPLSFRWTKEDDPDLLTLQVPTHAHPPNTAYASQSQRNLQRHRCLTISKMSPI